MYILFTQYRLYNMYKLVPTLYQLDNVKFYVFLSLEVQ
jgi:hypothetical protein